MESIKYLKEKLQELHNNCNYVGIKYEYKSVINTHVIDIQPKIIFENDENYVLSQISLEDEFEELFPEEEILFISKDNLISINESIFEIESIKVEEINVQGFAVLEANEIHFEEFINFDEEYITYNSLEDIGYIQVESDLDNEITIHSPPPKPWWKFNINKNDSKKDLEFFFT
ncbi:hypothetical protein [Kordia sp.]|uniref:hypothetical protein n=1 Tax=Kordia sp. TaxID=1965332 RepID=UPI003D6A3E1F